MNEIKRLFGLSSIISSTSTPIDKLNIVKINNWDAATNIKNNFITKPLVVDFIKMTFKLNKFRKMYIIKIKVEANGKI